MTHTTSKHDKLIETLEDRLKDRGFKTYRNIEYKDEKHNSCGEIDLLAIINGYHLLFEMKSNYTDSNHRYAMNQLNRAENYLNYYKPYGEIEKIFKFYVNGNKEGKEHIERVWRN